VSRQPTLDGIASLADRLRQDTLNWFVHLEHQEQDLILLGKAATLAEDLTRSTHLFVDVLERAAEEQQHDHRADEARDARMLERLFHRSAMNHVSVVLKAWLFDVRASQDALGHVLSSIVGPGNRKSMEARLNKAEPVAQIIDDFAPDYRAWFAEMRHIRNRVKDGERAVGMEYDPSGITTLTLSAFTPEHRFPTTEKERLPIRSFLVHGLLMTRALVALVVKVAKERSRTE
jgi:hypothetical protein